jgi:hypothetical protein
MKSFFFGVAAILITTSAASAFTCDAGNGCTITCTGGCYAVYSKKTGICTKGCDDEVSRADQTVSVQGMSPDRIRGILRGKMPKGSQRQ